MKEINEKIANAHTLRGLCKQLSLINKDLVDTIFPIKRNGIVHSVGVRLKTAPKKTVVEYHLDGADILDSIDNINLINYKIQELCLDLRENTQS